MENETEHIRILDGKFKGVIFQFGEVSLLPDEATDRCILKFTFQIHETNDDFTVDDLEESAEFRDEIGDILADYLTEKDFKIGKKTEKTEE